MWPIIAVPLGVGIFAVGKFIIDVLEEDACSARSEWRERSKELVEKTEACNRSLREQLTTAAQSVEFERLRNLHYQSHCTAQLVYHQLSNGRREIHALNQVLRQTVEARGELQGKIRSGSSMEREEARREWETLREFRAKLFEERDVLQDQMAAMQKQLKELNSNTHKLKLQIRDNCGHGGKVWFKRL